MSAVGNRKLTCAQMCLFSYCITVTQIEQQTVGNINVFCSFICCALTEVTHFIRLWSVYGQYSLTSSLLCILHVCVCVCVCLFVWEREVWRLWWLSFCLWHVALCIACFQPSDTRAMQNFYIKLMSLPIHCRSLRSLFVLVLSLIKKKCEVYCNNVVKLCW
jgi:hypothetical protein